MSVTTVYAAAFVVALPIAAVAMGRYWAGDRRFAGLVFAPVAVMAVAPLAGLIASLQVLGWLAIPLLAAQIIILVVMGRALLRIARSGATSKSADEFEEDTVHAMTEPALVMLGLILVGGLTALAVLLAYGISRATGS